MAHTASRMSLSDGENVVSKNNRLVQAQTADAASHKAAIVTQATYVKNEEQTLLVLLATSIFVNEDVKLSSQLV